MTSTAISPAAFLAALPADRRDAVSKLREVIVQQLPAGFEECMASGMLAYVVPHSKYPAGYHCNPKQPLPFLSLASQKNGIVLYHMGLYAMPNLLRWFREEFPKHSVAKPDMGKSCIRFKKLDAIPFALLAELMTKVTPDDWITCYESVFKK